MRTNLRYLPALFLIILVPCFAFAQGPVRDLKPTVVLISIDGFRPDYLDRFEPEYLRKLADSGVRAKWMIPSFPTKTFPNHYTIATGLLPENHGIVANNMYDPEFDAVFTLGKREEVQNPRWWGGEPIWVTAEKQGQKAGAFFFPGTETKIAGVQPSIWRQYDGQVPNSERVETVLSWFDLPVESRPTVMTLYFSDVDDAGHANSPFAKETEAAVHAVDANLRQLLSGLKKRKIRKQVNLIIVSDHGMAEVPRDNRILIEDLFDAKDLKRIFWVGEMVQIFPKEGRVDAVYDAIKSGLPDHATIYRKEEIPSRFKYQNHRRIAPILVLPDEGWVIANKERLQREAERSRPTVSGGSHGYDNNLASMRALFIGYGPAFKKGYVTEPFQNIEVYNLMCRILNLTPAPNDGTPGTLSKLVKAD